MTSGRSALMVKSIMPTAPEGPSALLDAELVGPPACCPGSPHFLLLPLLVAEVALERRLRTVRPEGQELGGDGFAYLPALLVEDVELRDVVDVPLDADMLADVVTKLVVRVECPNLVIPWFGTRAVSAPFMSGIAAYSRGGAAFHALAVLKRGRSA